MKTLKYMASKHIKKLEIKKDIFALLCFCVFAFSVFFVLSMNFTHAQIQVTSGDISVGIQPEIPGAFQNVTLTLGSFLVNLDKANIIWVVDEKTKLSGIGKKEFSLRVGGIGSKTTINVLIIIDPTNKISKKIIIQPGEIDLLWEVPNSYAPPFYKGKILPTAEAIVKVVAISSIKTNSGKLLTSSDLVYKWERNDEPQQSASGYRKNFFTFRKSFLNDGENISVTISSLDNRSQARGRITVNTYAPKIIFYEDHPLEGINYNRALNQGFRMRGKRATIVAEPYFFSPKFIKSPDLVYRWTINNKPIETPEEKNVLFLRLGEEGTGVATVSLAIESISRLFQSAESRMDITLGQ